MRIAQFCHPLKLRFFVDDTTALLTDKNKVAAERAKKKMMKKMKEVEKKASNCRSLKRERKERAR